jgi:peptide/nickel transport system permease protein
VKTFLAKFGRLVLVVVVVTFLTQLLTSFVPGELDEILAPFSTPEQRASIRADLGLDENIFVRYGRWLGDFAQGDLGKRYTGAQSSIPVGPEVKRALPISLELMFWSQLIALGLAIPLGIVAAYRQGKVLDRVISGTAFALLALPSFALALMLAYYLGARAGILPVLGYKPWSAGIWEHLRFMIIPAVSLAVGQLAVYLRLLRSDLIATLQQDFIAVAKAKGLKPRRILWRHALRPSSLTLLTVAGLQTGALIGGTIVVEVIFSIPGMGSLIGNAIVKRQYVELQSLVAIVAIVFVLVNFLVDYLYTLLDPRVRRG